MQVEAEEQVLSYFILGIQCHLELIQLLLEQVELDTLVADQQQESVEVIRQ
jgi:hypothetical protein